MEETISGNARGGAFPASFEGSNVDMYIVEIEIISGMAIIGLTTPILLRLPISI